MSLPGPGSAGEREENRQDEYKVMDIDLILRYFYNYFNIIGNSFSNSSWPGFLLNSAILKDSAFLIVDALGSPYHFSRHSLTALVGKSQILRNFVSFGLPALYRVSR